MRTISFMKAEKNGALNCSPMLYATATFVPSTPYTFSAYHKKKKYLISQSCCISIICHKYYSNFIHLSMQLANIYVCRLQIMQ